MVSAKKDYVRMIELPFYIRDQAKDGFTEFRISVLDPKKPKTERVQVRCWRNVSPAKNLNCEDCGQAFNNVGTLTNHQRASKHGRFA